MNRLSRKTSRYIPQEKNEPTVGIQTIFVRIRSVLNKTTFEILIFLILGGMIFYLVTSEQYFQITDIKILGLDTVATAHARDIVTTYLSQKKFGLHQLSYPFVNTDTLTDLLCKEIACDAITIQKKFPHTLLISVTEQQIRMRVVSSNGQALISQEGTLVRWIVTTSTNEVGGVPILFIDRPITTVQIHDSIIAPATTKLLMLAFNSIQTINHTPVTKIYLYDEPFEKVEFELEGGQVIILKLSGDLDIQIKKAHIAALKYPKAKSIDVRFSDKIFVSF